MDLFFKYYKLLEVSDLGLDIYFEGRGIWMGMELGCFFWVSDSFYGICDDLVIKGRFRGFFVNLKKSNRFI